MAKSKISKELAETVESHPNVQEVHFAADGHHYFNVFKHGKENYGRIATVPTKDKDGKVIQVKAPILETRIVETLSREDICGGSAPDNSKKIGALKQRINDINKALETETKENKINKLNADLEKAKADLSELE